MSARARKKRSAHRFLLTGATCCALGKYFPITTFRRLIAHTQLTFILFHSGLAFALLRSGVRPHRGAVDRIDGGVDGDYTLDVVALGGGFSGGGGGGGGGGDLPESVREKIDEKWAEVMKPRGFPSYQDFRAAIEARNVRWDQK